MRTPTRTARLAAAALSVLSLSACGKPLLYAEIEIPVAEVTLVSQTFPSTVNPLPQDLCPPGTILVPGNTCLQRTIGFDLGSDFRDITKDSVSFDLRLTDLGITLVSGLGDFSDVEVVVVGVDGSALGLPDAELASYRRSTADPSPTTIVVRARSNVDLGAYVQAGRLTLFTRMEFGRDIPEFKADVLAQFYLKVLVDYGGLGGIL